MSYVVLQLTPLNMLEISLLLSIALNKLFITKLIFSSHLIIFNILLIELIL